MQMNYWCCKCIVDVIRKFVCLLKTMHNVMCILRYASKICISTFYFLRYCFLSILWCKIRLLKHQLDKYKYPMTGYIFDVWGLVKALIECACRQQYVHRHTCNFWRIDALLRSSASERKTIQLFGNIFRFLLPFFFF